MGFDPMTHQPRTDLVSTLPYLLALANMTDLMDHQSLDEHAVRLQAEAVQLAKLQYLNYLIQSSNSLSTNSYDQNATTTNNMEPFSLLNSISNNVKENPLVIECLQPDTTTTPPGSIFSLHDGIASSQPLHHPSMVLPHLLDPQVSFSSQSCLNSEIGQGTTNFAMLSRGDHTVDHDTCSWIVPSPAPSSVPPNVIGTSAGDASSATSSYGGGGGGGPSPYWSELFLEDPIMHDLS